jgi:hypothetical protein
MTKSKQLERLGCFLDDEEETMLLDALNDIEGTRFRLSNDVASIIQMEIVIPPNPGEDKQFRTWFTSFVESLKTKPLKTRSQQVVLTEGLKRETLDAIRILSSDNVPLGYTLRRIFEYVRNDLEKEETEKALKAFREARTQTSDAMKLLLANVTHIRSLMAREPDMNGGGLLAKSHLRDQEKADAMEVVSSAISVLQSIYNSEMTCTVNTTRSVLSVFHDLLLDDLLPPEYGAQRQRYWGEMATLMTAAAAVACRNRKPDEPNHRYDHTTLQTRARRATPLKVMKYVKSLKALAPDLVKKVKSEGLAIAPDYWAAQLAYRPSAKAKLIHECASKLRSKK